MACRWCLTNSKQQRRIGHCSVVNYTGVEFVNSSANRKQGPAALTNKKQAYFEQRHADNVIKQSEVHIYRKK